MMRNIPVTCAFLVIRLRLENKTELNTVTELLPWMAPLHQVSGPEIPVSLCRPVDESLEDLMVQLTMSDKDLRELRW